MIPILCIPSFTFVYVHPARYSQKDPFNNIASIYCGSSNFPQLAQSPTSHNSTQTARSHPARPARRPPNRSSPTSTGCSSPSPSIRSPAATPAATGSDTGLVPPSARSSTPVLCIYSNCRTSRRSSTFVSCGSRGPASPSRVLAAGGAPLGRASRRCRYIECVNCRSRALS